MTPLQAMKQALEALEDTRRDLTSLMQVEDAITNLRTAIAEMEKAEPVACQVLRKRAIVRAAAEIGKEMK